ncbi:efflux RND transporter periplasmic adaptor subunit [Sphingobium sp. CCH11-B1]|uniref:efflux RND transporter periplasmic adaptor subunit n=1 Tax=Sphingobium sp. CCH11-B1 TaxID=1768781 RepID=UPI000833DDFC|nr:efflux RND transporter periplasmic adaptor subunit [Sphingobium sp. CCH11-B1]
MAIVGGKAIPMAAMVASCLLLAACQREQASPPPATPEVSVITLRPEDVTFSTELPGRTTPYRVAEVRPQVGGILLQRLFEEGSFVKAGQPLYQVNPAPYRATLERAQASLSSAQLLSERYDRLIKDNAISQQDRDDARAQYLAARAAVHSAQIDMGFTRISAPISGRIGRSAFTQGALVTASQPDALATIQQLDPIYVDIVQPSTALLTLREDFASGRLKAGGDGQAEVRLILENGKSYPQPGRLKFSEVSVDQGTGAVTLRAQFPNPDGVLLPGMFVRALLPQGMRSNALLVPQRAVTRDQSGQASVMIVDKAGKAQQRKVSVERSVGSRSLISAGLAAGDRVVVDGGQNVQPGAMVKTVAAAK